MDTQKDKSKYEKGVSNRIAREYFYFQRGLGMISELRYVVAGIFALYLLLKLDNPWIMLVLFIVSIPVIRLLGYFYIRYLAKAMDWFRIEHSTHWERYGFELQEKIIKKLEDIKKHGRK